MELNSTRTLDQELTVLSALAIVPNATSYDLSLYLWEHFKISRRSIKNILSSLVKTNLIIPFKDPSCPYIVYKLSEKGRSLAPYILPLKHFIPQKDILLFVSPETACKETGVSLSTIKRKKSFFTYVTIHKKLFIIKRFSSRSPEGKELIQKGLPTYPYITSINQIFFLFEEPPLVFVKKLLKLSHDPSNLMLFCPDIFKFVLLNYKTSDPLERSKNKRKKRLNELP